MPSLHLNELLAQGDVVVRLDGDVVMRAGVSAHVSGRESVHVGTNPVGGTVCSDRFSGTITKVTRAGDEGNYPVLPLADRVASRAPAFAALFVLSGLCSFLLVLWAQPESSGRRALLRRACGLLMPLLICGVPLLPLLKVHSLFGGDWANHQWIAAYYQRYFLAHWRFPEVINSHGNIGMVHGLFYGEPMYGVLAFAAALFGVDLVFRAAALGALLLQFVYVRRLFRIAGAGEILAGTAAALVTWSIYPLTNLYNRGAVPEFLAVCCLNAAASCLMGIALARNAAERRPMAAGLVLSVVLATSCHPITTLFGALSIVGLGLGCLLLAERKRYLLAVAALSCVLAGLVLAPWLFMVSTFYSRLHIVRTMPASGSAAALIYYNFDSFWTRMLPFSWDFGIRSYPLPWYFTPCLDAQTNVLLLLLALGVAATLRPNRFLTEKPRPVTLSAWAKAALVERPLVAYLACFGGILFAAALWISVDSHLPQLPSGTVRRLPYGLGFVGTMQFAYRLVSYQNLGLLIFATACVAAVGMGRPRKALLAQLCCVALGAGFISVVIKTTRTSQAPSGANFASDQEVLSRTLHASPDYSTMSEVERSAGEMGLPVKKLTLQVLGGNRFGEVLTAEISLDSPAVVATNVSIFPWNHLYVDGRAVDRDALIRDNFQAAVKLGAGSHRFEYRFEPDAIWRVLRGVSWISFAFLIGGFGVLSFRRSPAGELSTVPPSPRTAGTVSRGPRAIDTRGRNRLKYKIHSK